MEAAIPIVEVFIVDITMDIMDIMAIITGEDVAVMVTFTDPIAVNNHYYGQKCN